MSGADGFPDAFDQGFAFLAREQPPQLVFSREDVRASLVEDVRTILDRADRPRGGCAVGGQNGRIRLFRVRLRVLADDVSEV